MICMCSRLFATSLRSACPIQCCTLFIGGGQRQLIPHSSAVYGDPPQRLLGYSAVRRKQQRHSAVVTAGMDTDFQALQPLVQRIHDSPSQTVIYATGGGIQVGQLSAKVDCLHNLLELCP